MSSFLREFAYKALETLEKHGGELPFDAYKEIKGVLQAALKTTYPLTDEEIVGHTCECVDDGTFNMACAIDFAREIERAHGIKK